MKSTNNTIKIAIPIAEGRLCAHFGHCGQFAVIVADKDGKTILSREELTPPPHEPGVLPAWLAKMGVQIVFAGGMGRRAQELFGLSGIDALVGLPSETPERLVEDYFAGVLAPGENICDH